jgi:hypothetical protein|eukprot:COSAG06_NODE_4662_length_4056_cov_5.308820_3_plen_71_part_00
MHIMQVRPRVRARACVRTVPKSLLSIDFVAVVTSPSTAACTGSVAEPDTLHTNEEKREERHAAPTTTRVV